MYLYIVVYHVFGVVSFVWVYIYIFDIVLHVVQTLLEENVKCIVEQK